MSPSAAESSRLQLDRYEYNEQINLLIEPALDKFHKLARSYAFFNLAFLTLAITELTLFVLFFAILSKSSVLAYSLAVMFFTFFSFFILRLYFRTSKPEQFLELREEYIEECKRVLCYREGVPELHLALATALCKFSSRLHEVEYSYYRPPDLLEAFSTSMEKLSCWLHWKDVFQMRELLLSRSVEEHIRLVKCEPTNLEVHAALANAYVLLSSLYANPKKWEGYDEEKWIPPDRYSSVNQQKFRETAERAIEEFKILNDYAPDDPWVHAQLAYSYHDLKMPEEEILEYETLLKLQPGDREVLFKLGTLYFQQGHNAKGLRIYEELRRTHYKKAESLIRFYGSYSPWELEDSESSAVTTV